jgi:23S rRNA (pseudouridine1915-N3)-methyltransferase
VKLKIAWVGKTKERAIESLTEEYTKRISHYAQIEHVALKDQAQILSLANNRQNKHTLVLLDSTGKQFSSEELAQYMGDYRDHNSLPMLFAIGPANGFSAEARKSAALVLSLGKMTLAHELARIVLLEQIYRAFTILQGHPYHLGH